MSAKLNKCLLKHNKAFKDFDKSEVIEASKVYQSRGQTEDAANVSAIEDHLRELEAERDRIDNDILDQWKKADPKGYAKAEKPKATAPVVESQARATEAEPVQATPKQSGPDRAKAALDAAGVNGTDRLTTITTPLADQSTAATLNEALVKYGLGANWSNAYEAVELPDALSGIRKEIQVAFGRDIRPVAPTNSAFDQFNGIYVGGEIYVNIANDVGFVQIAGHELYHDIERARPELIEWYRGQARQYLKDLPEYKDRLNKLIQPNETAYTDKTAESELLADFMGDSLADPVFLQQLADSNPSRFKQFVNSVRLWLASVANKLRGLESSEYITDVRALQKYLGDVLNAYADGKPIDSVDGVPLFHRADHDTTTFYSQLSRVIEQASDKIFGPAQQVKLWLMSNAAKLAVKKEEIQWTGITDFLDLQGKEKASKADVLAYLEQNGVQVEEVVLSADAELQEYKELVDLSGRATREQKERRSELAKKFGGTAAALGAPKFSTHAPPGGKPGTYRELLLTLPDRGHPMEREIRALGITKPLDDVSGMDVTNSGGTDEQASRWMDSFDGHRLGNNFQSSHFAHKNILAHLRVDEVEGANGERLLRVVEAQSDWGQQARKEGIKGKLPEGYAVVEQRNGEWVVKNADGAMIAQSFGRTGQDGKSAAIDNAMKELAGSIRAVPDAPFIGDTQAWLSLAIKKAISYAAENGFDGIVFATGQQNADLYDLSKQVDEVTYMPDGNGMYTITANKGGANILNETGASLSRIEDLVGKGVATKVSDGNGTPVGSSRGFDDATKPQSIRELGDDVFGREMASLMALNHVDGSMLSMLKHDQVFRAIVEAIPVDVVDILRAVNASPDDLLSKKDVVSSRLSADGRRRAADGVLGALRLTHATIGTKLRSVLSGKRDGEVLSTLRASDLNATEVAGIISPSSVFHGGTSFGSPQKTATAGTGTKSTTGDNSIVLSPAALADLLNAHYALLKRENNNIITHPFVSPKHYSIKGSNLRVEATGMMAFYDKIVPQVADKVLKQIGADVKVAEVTLRREVKPNIRRLDGPRMTRFDSVEKSVHPGFLLTPAIRDKAEQGLPLFSRKGNQTETEAFKKWFGNSAVVAADGKPLVVYHGTGFSIRSFRSNRGMIYFARDPETAYDFADSVATAQEDMGNYDDEIGRKSEDGGASIYPVYLSVQNPFDPDNQDHLAKLPRHIAAEVGRGGHYDDVERHGRTIRAAGFDGVYVRERGGESPDERDIAVFDPTQIKSAVGNRGTFDPKNPDIRYSRKGQSQLPISSGQPPAPPTRQTPLGLSGGSSGNTPTWDAPISTGLDDIAYKLQNKNIDLKRVIQSIKEAGRAIPDKFDPYLQEELFHKRAAKRTEDFVDRELNPLLKDAALRGLKLDEIDQYLHARHAEEANKLAADRNPGSLQDGGSGMKTADAKAYLNGLTAAKRKNLETIAAKVDAIISTTRNLYASYGLESANTVQGWSDMFDHYVPLMREDQDGGMGVGQGFSIKGREVKHRTGSTATVVDILANIAMQREKVIVRGEKNRVAVALAGLAKLNPNSDFWEVGKIPTEQVLNEKTGLVETRPDPMFKSRENAIVAKISDGKGGVQEIAILFDEHNERAMRMAGSLKNLDAAQLEGILGISAVITRYFASINTQYNPVFGVVNLVRDYQGAAINLASTSLAGHKAAVMNPLTVMSALKGIYLDTRAERKGGMAMSQWAQLWEEFNLEGGTTGYRDLFRTSEDRANKIESTLDPTKWMDSKLGKIFTAGGALKVPMFYAQKKAGWLFDWLSDYNLAMENSVRLSAYKVALDQGMSKQRAASVAKNLTVNFNRKGQLGQQAGALYAFFNASMQGTARIAETLTTMDKGDIKTLRLSKTGAVIVGGGVLLGAMQALMLAAAGFDDDEPPEFVRERNLIIPIGGKKYITIPMPLGFHVLPNMGRIPTELMLRGGRDAGDSAINLIGTIIEAFNPTGSAGVSWQTVMPTPLDPAMALTENKDWTGKPIARQSFNHATPGHALAKDIATHPGRWIAEALNYVTGGDKYTRGSISPTPDQIDYLGAQLGGGVLRELGKLNQSVSSAFTGEELPPHKIPLAGRFYGDAEGSSSHGAAFYKNVERLNEIEAEIKGRRQDGLPTDKYRLENPEAKLIALANDAEREVSKLRKVKRELIEKDASRERVKLIEMRITGIMKRLNERVNEVRQ